MRDIPVNLNGFKLMVTEEPTTKTRETDDGRTEVVTDSQGATRFVVSLFAKRRPSEPGERVGKGEEIKVTLSTDPGDGFEEGSYIELIDATVSPWEIRENGRMSSGVSFKARGLKPLG